MQKYLTNPLKYIRNKFPAFTFLRGLAFVFICSGMIWGTLNANEITEYLSGSDKEEIEQPLKDIIDEKLIE